MFFNSKAFSGIENLRRGMFNANHEQSKGRARRSSDKKRSAPKPYSLRMENLEERQLLSVVSSLPPRKSELSQLPMIVSALSLYSAFS